MSDRTTTNPGFAGSRPRVQNADASSSDVLRGRDMVHLADGYAGDVSPQLAWAWVQDGGAVIVDVRTDAEREWVGFVPGAVALAWKQWPQMQLSPAFEAGLQQFEKSTRLLMLCRSGVRSIAAARAAAERGFQAFNTLEGFEGDRDTRQHRGHINGWKYRGLPWSQN